CFCSLLAITTASHAQPGLLKRLWLANSPPEPPPRSADLPPEEFDHPYKGKLTIMRLPLKDVRLRCANAITVMPGPVLACARVSADGSDCTIFLPSDDVIRASGKIPDEVLRHERGHCNGWTHHRK